MEHLEYVAYYEMQRAGLGARYLAAFDKAMEAICAHPERFRLEDEPGIRRYRMAGFPYNILFRQSYDAVEVLAVAPHRRRPRYWLGRG